MTNIHNDSKQPGVKDFLLFYWEVFRAVSRMGLRLIAALAMGSYFFAFGRGPSDSNFHWICTLIAGCLWVLLDIHKLLEVRLRRPDDPS